MYVALCNYDTIRLMEIALGRQINDDIISGAIASVSWAHLCWICGEMRTHYLGVAFLLMHLSYIFGYVSGESTDLNYCGNISKSSLNHLFIEYEDWYYYMDGKNDMNPKDYPKDEDRDLENTAVNTSKQCTRGLRNFAFKNSYDTGIT